MNVRLLRRIEKRILKEPGQFNMGVWVRRWFPKSKRRPCGTEACIAGWACLLSKSGNSSDFQNTAIRLLGLSSEQSLRLFSFASWPPQFQTTAKEGTLTYARNAVRRIECFIKTRGAE